MDGFDKEKELEILWAKITRISAFADSPIRQLKETLELADFLENIYKRGYEEGHRIKVLENN